MRKYTLWGTRIIPFVLLLTLFIPFLSPFCFTNNFIGTSNSPLSILTDAAVIRPTVEALREGYGSVVSVYVNAQVSEAGYLADILPVVAIALFAVYIIMAIGAIITFGGEARQNAGARVVKISGLFAIFVNFVCFIITYGASFTVKAADPTAPKVVVSAYEYGMVQAFPFGLILSIVLVLLLLVSVYIFSYINTQSVRAAMKILASSRAVENPGKRMTFQILCYVVAILIALLFLVPFFYTFINAIRYVTNPPTTVWPTPAHFENFVYAITKIPFWNYMQSSLIILGLSLSLQITMNYIFAYAFARLNAPGKEFLFGIVITLMMIPGIATQIPQFALFQSMKIANTFWIWFLLGLAGKPNYIFLYRQFMQGLPKELEESAKLDGCNLVQIMWKIFVPITAPVIATVFMFEFLQAWGNVTLPFMYLDIAKWPLCNALMGVNYVLPNTSITMEPLVMAMTVIFIIPSVCVYTFGQKYLREGMITSGLKG